LETKVVTVARRSCILCQLTKNTKRENDGPNCIQEVKMQDKIAALENAGHAIAIFGDFFASCVVSEPRAAGFRPVS